MKKIILALPILFVLWGCEGYRSINSTNIGAEGEKGIDAADIYIQKVEVRNPERKAGERRLAQTMAQELSRRYTGGAGAPFHVEVMLKDRQQSLSSRRDATVSRWMYFLSGSARVMHNGKEIAKISSTADAPYVVDASPVATQANRRQAEDAAAFVLTRDMHRQLSTLLYNYRQQKAE